MRTLSTTTLLASLTMAMAIGCGKSKDDSADKDPPIFTGIVTAEVVESGTARLTWGAADDPSQPITYEIFHATISGNQAFGISDALVTVTDATEITIADLHPGAGLRHYFVVRARDNAGNIDKNTKEEDVLFQANGLNLVGRFNMSLAADLQVDPSKDIAVVSGWFNENVAIIDISDKANPSLIAELTGQGYGADVQIKGDNLYLSHEFGGRGFDIYDITNPSSPQLRKQVGPSTGYPANLEDCHNLWPQDDRELLYCASTTTGELVILSTGDTGQGLPDDPVYVTELAGNGESGIHDMYAIGNRLYAAFLDDGIHIYDITDATTPLLIGKHTYSRNFTHNLWPNAAGTVLYSTDENARGHLRVWDISDVDNISQIGEYQANVEAVIHNVEVIGDYAYISYYVEGVKVVDVSDPTKPVEVGAHDFYTGPDDAGFYGNWGVDPHPPYVYATGMETGLYITEFSAPAIGPPQE